MTSETEPKKRKLPVILIVAGVLVFLCVVCGIFGVISRSTPEAKATAAARALERTAEASRPTATPRPTDTPHPTNTPKPTNTPRPTNTPAPTLTPTPIPEPIILNGNGDSVVDMEKWSGPAIARITYTGSRNFAVWNYDSNGEKIDLLVNIIGRYQGTVPIDFLDNQHTARFEVNASGQWEIQVLPLSEIRREQIPGTITGTGDDVIFLDGTNPDLLQIDATKAKGNFAIWAYGNRRNLVVNEIATYQGTVVVSRDTIILVISEGGGEWTIEVTTK